MFIFGNYTHYYKKTHHPAKKTNAANGLQLNWFTWTEEDWTRTTEEGLGGSAVLIFPDDMEAGVEARDTVEAFPVALKVGEGWILLLSLTNLMSR